jgi:hypothetical protein
MIGFIWTGNPEETAMPATTSETLKDVDDVTAQMLIDLQVHCFHRASERSEAKGEGRRKDYWVADADIFATHRAMTTILNRALFDLPAFGHRSGEQTRYANDVADHILDEAKAEYNRQTGEEHKRFPGAFEIRI